MTAEVDLFKHIYRNVDPVLEGSFSVEPGTSHNINYLTGIKITVFCNIEDESAAIFVNGRDLRKRVKAILYTQNEDLNDDGQIVNPNYLIRVREGQILAIFSKRGRKKEVNVSFYKGESI